MTNAIVVPDTFKGPVAPIFAGAEGGDDLSGGITGGYGLLKYRGKVWSIQYRNNIMNLMRDDGDGPRGSVDIVVVKANGMLSKTYYEAGWDENNNNPPDCASANGIVPDVGVPKPQSTACLGCPKNAWNSDPKGGKGKACSDHRRLAIVPMTDLRNEMFGGPMLLRCPAMSLQDLSAFDARYKAMGYPYFTMAIKVGFDPQESYPKFTFAAIRPLTQEEGVIVMELRNSAETARVIAEGSAPALAEATPAAAPAFLEPIPTGAIKPQVSPPAATQPAGNTAQPASGPVVVGTPGTVSAPVTQPAKPAQPAAPASAGGFGVAKPANVQPATVSNGGGGAATPATGTGASGFGPTSAGAAPQPAGQAPAKQPVQMTGFGGVAEVPQQVTRPVGPDPASGSPVSPAVEEAFAGSIDERLNALLNN